MVTTLYLVRHGKTVGSDIKTYKGSIDIPMSEAGIEQIKNTAGFISNYDKASRLSAVYCSPLSRAVKSAEIIAEAHGLTPLISPDLMERHFGIWEGMSYTEIKEKYPEEFEAWANNPLIYSPTNGESTLEVRDRIIPALENIISKHNGESIAIVAHGGVNRIILCHILGIPLENIFRVEQNFGGVSVIEFWDKYPVVKLLNGGAPG